MQNQNLASPKTFDLLNDCGCQVIVNIVSINLAFQSCNLRLGLRPIKSQR